MMSYFALISVAEPKLRSDHKVLDRSRGPNFACLGVGHDPRSDMDCYATDVLANLLDFASVQGCSYFDSQPLNIAADCKGATDGTSPSKVAKKPRGRNSVRERDEN